MGRGDSRSRSVRSRSRSYERRDRDDRRPRRSRRDESGDESSRSRERARRRRHRKSGWDAMPTGNEPPAPMPITQPSAMNVAAPSGNKRSREVWVGNLLQGAVTPTHLKDFFTQMFNALPEYQQKYHQLVEEGKSSVRDIQMANNSPYAFIEFWTEELAATAVEFNQVEFMGRPMKTGRPTGYSIMGPPPIPLDLTPLRMAGLLPGSVAHVENPVQNKKQRELYFGNLPLGQLNSESIRQLLTPACELLPDYNASLGGPVVSVNMSGEGKFCFVEFQNERLATAVMPIFNGMEIFGRKITVGRPTGYVDPNAPAPILALNTLMGNNHQQAQAQQHQQSQNVTGAMAAGALAVAGLGM